MPQQMHFGIPCLEVLYCIPGKSHPIFRMGFDKVFPAGSVPREPRHKHVISLIEKVGGRPDELSGISPVAVNYEPALICLLFVKQTERAGRAATLREVAIQTLIPFFRDGITENGKVCQFVNQVSTLP